MVKSLTSMGGFYSSDPCWCFRVAAARGGGQGVNLRTWCYASLSLSPTQPQPTKEMLTHLKIALCGSELWIQLLLTETSENYFGQCLPPTLCFAILSQLHRRSSFFSSSFSHSLSFNRGRSILHLLKERKKNTFFEGVGGWVWLKWNFFILHFLLTSTGAHYVIRWWWRSERTPSSIFRCASILGTCTHR